jgi:ABC-type transport system substrate-binding protein
MPVSKVRRNVTMANETRTTKSALSRRSLLRTAAGGSAAAAATPWLLAPRLAQAGPSAAQGDEQVLRVAFEGSATAEGYVPGWDTDRSITPFVFMTPFLANNANELIPWLATSVDANADNTVFTMHLDPRAVWSDGQAVTAPQFKAWYEWVSRPEHDSGAILSVLEPVEGFAAVIDGSAETIEGIVAVDDQTLEYHLIRAEGFFPSRLAEPQAAIGRLEQYQPDPENVWLGENAADLIVNGPFRPTALNPEPEGTYFWEQNPAWWGDEKPTITRIEASTVRDFQTMLLLFQNGQIDMAYYLSGAPAVQLRQEQPEVFRDRPAYGYFSMYMDTTKEPLTDRNLRLALLHAIDWESLAEVAWEGEMLPTTAGNLMSPAMECRDDTYEPYPFDVDRAQEFLAQSTYGSGENVPKIRVSTEGSDPPRQRAAAILQEFWRVNLGIENVEIKNVETEFGTEEELIAIYTASGGGKNPALLLQSQGHSKGFAAQEWTHLNVPELDEGVDALLTMDPADQAYCPEATRLLQLLQDQAAIIPMAYIKGSYQIQPWLMNVEVNAGHTFYTLLEMSIQR